MNINRENVRVLLKEGDFTTLFIEGLGWDHHDQIIVREVYGRKYTLTAIAQKRGLVAWRCVPSDLGTLPESNVRRIIERLVAKVMHEHLIVFLDGKLNVQIWQWVKREHNMPSRYREHALYSAQDGESLIQKLETLTFTLEEENRLSLTDVTRRLRFAFDVEQVTKSFYRKFRDQRREFLKFLQGIEDTSDCEWYASILLNRLMFVYFLQKKGFLDDDVDYLKNRLTEIQSRSNKDPSISFYRSLLLPLFHFGLGSSNSTPHLSQLLGRIPYLDGGLFEVHELERSSRYGKSIQIANDAFESLFDFFDSYHWHLDDRPLRADNEINPDVLGYIFEKYINQKELGAYYTQEDITGYICANTILPAILNLATSFNESREIPHSGYDLAEFLQADPDRYIHAPMRYGTEWADVDNSSQGTLLQDSGRLPIRIARGVEPDTAELRVLKSNSLEDMHTLSIRQEWNADAFTWYGHTSESWRDAVDRHRRCKATRDKLTQGQVSDIDEMITLNLDIRQFVQDLIETCNDPSFLRSIWIAVRRVTILDPTCGSGAFLFAALSLLEPLYEACLDRMEFLLAQAKRSEQVCPNQSTFTPPPPLKFLAPIYRT